MDKEEQVSLLVQEQDEVEDSSFQLIRKSKLQNIKTNINVNGGSIHEAQNGNSKTNGVDGHLLKPEINGGHQETEISNGVYYDKDEGIWKCRFCCWTYQPGSYCIDHARNAKEHLNIVIDEKMFNQADQCVNFDIKGGNFISVFSEEESPKEGAIESSYIGSQNGIDDTIGSSYNGSQNGIVDTIGSSYNGSQNGIVDTIGSSYNRSQNGIVDTIGSSYNRSQNGIVDTSPNSVIGTKDDSFSDSNLQSSGVIDDITTIQETSTIKEIESAGTDLIDGSDLEVAEVDLEKVLQDQKTHDLYCPNCNSCITRRVILRKRKRRTRPLTEDVKRNKLEAEIETEAGAGSSEPISNQGPPIPPAEGNDRDGEPELFRCLACFSFFIPAGNGFKLFGRKKEKSNSQKDQISEPNKNWFSSIFAPNKERTPQEQGILDKENKESNDKKLQTPLLTDNENKLSSLPDRSVSAAYSTEGLHENEAIKPQESAVLVNMTTDVTYKSQDNGVKDELGVDNGKETLLHQKYDEGVTIDAGLVALSNGEGAADSVLETRLDGLKFLISSDGGPELPDGEALRNDSVTNNKAYIAVDIPREYEQPIETLPAADTSKVGDTNIQSEDTLKAHWEVAAKSVSHKETIVTVGAGTEVASQITKEATVSTRQVASQVIGQVSVVSQRASEAGESYGIEIIKSIVYGGLVESITSLSVVSSAAGGGAATLHTLALGMANLIGGIFIICHNLYQLNNDQADDAINQVSQKNDKYRELLGKRKNFALHAFVAVLSYLIFGLLPPILFGFSFRKSDDRELKLAVVAAASFLCILVLAIAKAYVQTPPKTYIRTVVRYLILGILVSGVSYVAGELFENLLDDLGLFENPISVPTLSLPVKPSNNQAWASY